MEGGAGVGQREGPSGRVLWCVWAEEQGAGFRVQDEVDNEPVSETCE